MNDIPAAWIERLLVHIETEDPPKSHIAHVLRSFLDDSGDTEPERPVVLTVKANRFAQAAKLLDSIVVPPAGVLLIPEALIPRWPIVDTDDDGPIDVEID